MAWSTREVAELAGTTVNTVRHYHREGLLELPDRTSNGYKQYQVRHLVRLLQIRRLRELGVPLDRIEQVGTTGENSTEALEAIDADLAASIEQLVSRGVRFTRFDGLEQDDRGVWTTPNGDRVAWFADPDGNVLSLTQFR